MASYSVKRAKSATLTSTTADTVTFTQLWPACDVANDDGTNDLWVRVDGVTAVADADNATRVPAGQSKVIQLPIPSSGNQALSLVGNGGAYTVEGVN